MQKEQQKATGLLCSLHSRKQTDRKIPRSVPHIILRITNAGSNAALYIFIRSASNTRFTLCKDSWHLQPYDNNNDRLHVGDVNWELCRRVERDWIRPSRTSTAMLMIYCSTDTKTQTERQHPKQTHTLIPGDLFSNHFNQLSKPLRLYMPDACCVMTECIINQQILYLDPHLHILKKCR